jgi:hypothetical protein
MKRPQSILLTLLLAGPAVALSSSAADPLDQWQARNSGSTNYLEGICYAQGLFVAGGEQGNILTSTDGTSWTSRTPENQFGIDSIAYGNGRFVAVGTGPGNPLYGSYGVAAVSVDGVAWPVPTAVFSQASGTLSGLWYVAYGNGVFVALGSTQNGAACLSSTDGKQWAIHYTMPGIFLTQVAFGGGEFLAVGWNQTTGDGSPILASSDGTNWIVATNATTARLWGVAYGEGAFVAVGQNVVGAISASRGGIIWTTASVLGNQSLNGIAYGQGTFVAVGGNGLVLTSPDGIQWTQRNAGTSQSLQSVAFGGGTFVLAGASGALLQSGALPAPEVRLSPLIGEEPGEFRVVLTGTAGQYWQVQASSDLEAWTPLASVLMTAPTIQVTDSGATNRAIRFYRAVSY